MATNTAERSEVIRTDHDHARDSLAVRQALEDFARAEHLSRSEVLRQAIREYLRPRGFWPPAGSGQAGGG